MERQETRNKVVLGVLLVILVVSIIALLVLAYRQVESPGRPSEQGPASTRTAAERGVWGGLYYYAGMPRPTRPSSFSITVLTNTGYVVGYCEQQKDPVWVCYRLVRVDSLQAPPRPHAFEVDARTRARVSQHDYTGSGYDRGHMAPNYAIALCFGSHAQMETFLMSNIIPQRPNLNRRVWEHLEEAEIKDYAQRYKQLWVVDGPVFKGATHRLSSGVQVPDACYRIMIEEEHGRPNVLAFIVPENVQGTELPAEFLTSVAEVEKETGLDFFSELPRDLQNSLEAKVASGMW